MVYLLVKIFYTLKKYSKIMNSHSDLNYITSMSGTLTLTDR